MPMPLRALIVEDTPDDAELMALRLAEDGFHPEWQRVDNEPDYLAALEKKPDLILADWNLPQFSGLRALRLMRERGLDIPFLIVSGSIGEEAAIEALHQGACDFVWKDRPTRLGHAVRRALDDKRLREERRLTEERLQQLNRAVEQSPVSVVITDSRGDIEYVNPKFTEVTGYTLAEVRGKNPRILKSGEMPAEHYRELWTSITAGKKWSGEFRNRRKDGTLFWEQASISALRDPSGAITHFLAVKEDVTVRKALEAQLAQAQKMESIGRLAGGVAHDFNNLLTVINGYCDLMQRRLNPADPLLGPLGHIRKAGDRAAELTRQLLAFSRKQIIQPKPMNLNDLITEAQDMLQRLVGEDVELAIRPAPGLGQAMVDRGQFHQVLMNLAVNARDAMPKGGMLTIATENVELHEDHPAAHPEAAPGPYVRLVVSDPGTGMDTEILGHLFEPFFTTKREGVGTGLGLSTVYGIVRQSGGWIQVDSEPGHGSQFQIYVPRIEAPVAADQAPVPAAEALRGPETILVVEDQEEVRKLAVECLESYGYQVLEARSSSDALLLASHHEGPIHLLLTDVVMPQMGGKELAESLKPLRPEMKVLYMSGYTRDAIVHHGVLDSGVNFIAKPFAPDALALKVRIVLGLPHRVAKVLVAEEDESIRNLLREMLESGGHEVLAAGDAGAAMRMAREIRPEAMVMNLAMMQQLGGEAVRDLRAQYPGLGVIAYAGAFGGDLSKAAKQLGADTALAQPIRPDELLETVRALAAKPA